MPGHHVTDPVTLSTHFPAHAPATPLKNGEWSFPPGWRGGYTDRAARDSARALDRAWFAAHRHRETYLRVALPGEFPMRRRCDCAAPLFALVSRGRRTSALRRVPYVAWDVPEHVDENTAVWMLHRASVEPSPRHHVITPCARLAGVED
jgi:hypothetical protein